MAGGPCSVLRGGHGQLNTGTPHAAESVSFRVRSRTAGSNASSVGRCAAKRGWHRARAPGIATLAARGGGQRRRRAATELSCTTLAFLLRGGFNQSGAPPSADDERALVHVGRILSPCGDRAFRQPPPRAARCGKLALLSSQSLSPWSEEANFQPVSRESYINPWHNVRSPKHG